MTKGQELALAQLQAIESCNPQALEIVRDTLENNSLYVDISLECRSMARSVTGTGLPLNSRERFRIRISPEFPYFVPSVSTYHTRFSGFPHVQWQRHLCLYQSPSTEWNPKDGMFGFMERLGWWLAEGALGRLDPIGLPLHPPAVYSSSDTPVVVIRPDTPTFHGDNWLGFAALDVKSPSRISIVDWHEFDHGTSVLLAPVVLLRDSMPHEFPSRLNCILSEIEKRGVSRQRLFPYFQKACLQPESPDSPMYIVVGSAMRGVSGRCQAY